MINTFTAGIEAAAKGFEEYLHGLGYRINTIRGIGNNIKRFALWCGAENVDMAKATYNHLLAYMDACKGQGNKNSTINQKIMGIRYFYDYLMNINERKDNPATALHIRGGMRKIPHGILKKEELEAIYTNYKASGIAGKRNKAMLGLLIYQGITTAELSRLELSDVRLEEGKINIRPAGRSNSRVLKLKAPQMIPLQNYLVVIRPVLVTMTEKQTDKLFMSIGKGMGMSNSYARMLKYVQQANPSVKNLKQIRSSVLTCWLKEYGVRQVQYMAGHRYVSSTDLYRTDKLESLQEQLEKLHPMQ